MTLCADFMIYLWCGAAAAGSGRTNTQSLGDLVNSGLTNAGRRLSRRMLVAEEDEEDWSVGYSIGRGLLQDSVWLQTRLSCSPSVLACTSLCQSGPHVHEHCSMLPLILIMRINVSDAWATTPVTF